MARIEAHIAGERDRKVLAEMAQPTIRPEIPALIEALAGRFSAHHAVVARQIIVDVASSTVPSGSSALRSPSGPPISRLRSEALGHAVNFSSAA